MSEYGYQNQIAAHQTPKGRQGSKERDAHWPNYYTKNPRYNYTPYADCPMEVPLVKKGHDYGGDFNDQPGWYCPDCGAPSTEERKGHCRRCGSQARAEYREGAKTVSP